MSLLPPTATFHELVQECFVIFRGHGVSLSPRDVELVDAWADRAVPFEVVARGIRRAAEAQLVELPGDPAKLHSLAACRRAVEREIGKYLRATSASPAATQAPAATHAQPGETATAADLPAWAARSDAGAASSPVEAEAWHVARHRKLQAALRRIGREHPGLAASVNRWLPRLPIPTTPEAADRQESLALALLFRALDGPARRALLREARVLVQNAGLMTARAQLESLRFHREILLRRALALPSFW